MDGRGNDEWLTLAMVQAMDPGPKEQAAALRVAAARLVELGVSVDPGGPGRRPSLGAAGFGDHDLLIYHRCGRLRAPSAIQI